MLIESIGIFKLNIQGAVVSLSFDICAVRFNLIKLVLFPKFIMYLANVFSVIMLFFVAETIEGGSIKSMSENGLYANLCALQINRCNSL